MTARRQFLSLTAAGAGAVLLSALPGTARAVARHRDFHFVQMSDSHWGYAGPANPRSTTTLIDAVATVNALQDPPDFVVFTGDLTQTTDDPVERRGRMREFQQIVSRLEVATRFFLPGEHDAAIDGGVAYRELFGDTHYSFDHKGIHFIALDNVSDPGAALGTAQLEWLRPDLATQAAETPVIVFAHRPLFDLAPEWDWATRDGAAAIEILAAQRHVTVFYGHIHQEHHFMTGQIAHHSARSLIFPLPAPGSQEKRAPLPWNPAAPFQGLGVRAVETSADRSEPHLQEIGLHARVPAP